MGLFSSLFGRPDAPIADPDRLRDELFAAARAGDARRLERLARANQAAVLEHFRSWLKVPEAVRADPAAVQGYVGGMVAVAQVFAEKLGRPNSWRPSPARPGRTRWRSGRTRSAGRANGWMPCDTPRPARS